VTSQNMDTLNDQLHQDAKLTSLNDNHEAYRVQVHHSDVPVTFTKPMISGEYELLVPAKEAAKVLGLSLDWKQATHTVKLTKGKNSLEMTADAKHAKSSNDAITLETAPVLKRGTVYIPLVAVSSLLGFTANSQIEGHNMHVFINPLP